MENVKEMIEALLFSSGRAMSIEKLQILTGIEPRKVKSALKKLQKEYLDRNSSLMIVSEEDSWKISVHETYLPLVRQIVADTELPKSIIETLAVIAWKNPISQAKVVDIRSNKAYEHIAELERLGFVVKEKLGRSFSLKLTEKFFDYFDISGGKDIREMFKNVRGVESELEEEQTKRLKEQRGVFLMNSSHVYIGPELGNVKETSELIDEINHDEKAEEIINSEIDEVDDEISMNQAEEKFDKKDPHHVDLPVEEVSEIVDEITTEEDADEVIESSVDVVDKK